MVGNTVVVFTAVNLVREGVELSTHLAKLRDDNFLVLATRAWIGGRAALHMHIETAAADERQRRRKMESERENFARVNQFRRLQSHFRLHQIARADFVLCAPL